MKIEIEPAIDNITIIIDDKYQTFIDSDVFSGKDKAINYLINFQNRTNHAISQAIKK